MTHFGDRTPPSDADILLARIHKQLDMLAENHEALAEERESLLLERSAFRSRGKQVQAQRFRTGEVEVAFMDAVRRFCNEHGSAFPSALTAAYDAVQEERDKLGSLEIDYYQNEEALASKEWDLTEKENEFYQYTLQEHLSEDLVDHRGRHETANSEAAHSSPKPAALPSLVQYQAATAEEHELMTRFNALRHERVGVLYMVGTLHFQTTHKPGRPLETPEDYNGYFDLLEALATCKVRIQRMKVKLLQSSIPAALILFPNSPKSPPSNQTPLPLQTYPQKGSTSNLPISDRLSEWLMEYLRSSALERILYFNILQGKLDLYGVSSFGYASWEDAAATFWLSDQSYKSIKAEEDPHAMSLQSGLGSDAEPGSVVVRKFQQDSLEFASEPILGTGQYFQPNFNPVPRSLSDHKNQWSCSEEPVDIPIVVDCSRDSSLHDRVQASLRGLIVPPLLENSPKEVLLTDDKSAAELDTVVKSTPSNITPANKPPNDLEHISLFEHSMTATGVDKPSAIKYARQDTLLPLATSCVSESSLKAPEPPRYDSCQEPEPYEFRPTTTPIAEAVDLKPAQLDIAKHDAQPDHYGMTTVDTKNVELNDSTNDDKNVHSVRVGAIHDPEDGVSTLSRPLIGLNGIISTPRGEIPSLGQKSALRHDIVQSPMFLRTPSLPRPRPHSVAGDSCRTPRSEGDQLQVPLVPQHQRTRSDNIINSSPIRPLRLARSLCNLEAAYTKQPIAF